MNSILILIIALQNIWPSKGSILFIIGLMIEHGTHWVVLLVVSVLKTLCANMFIK